MAVQCRRSWEEMRIPPPPWPAAGNFCCGKSLPAVTLALPWVCPSALLLPSCWLPSALSLLLPCLSFKCCSLSLALWPNQKMRMKMKTATPFCGFSCHSFKGEGDLILPLSCPALMINGRSIQLKACQCDLSESTQRHLTRLVNKNKTKTNKQAQSCWI